MKQTNCHRSSPRNGLRAAQEKEAAEADLRVLQHQIETAPPLGTDELNEVARISGTAAAAG
jgi:hypothetical protein